MINQAMYTEKEAEANWPSIQNDFWVSKSEVIQIEAQRPRFGVQVRDGHLVDENTERLYMLGPHWEIKIGAHKFDVAQDGAALEQLISILEQLRIHVATHPISQSQP
jgi:hypothetical protein